MPNSHCCPDHCVDDLCVHSDIGLCGAERCSVLDQEYCEEDYDDDDDDDDGGWRK